MSRDHVHQSAPGEDTCFVCGVSMEEAIRVDAGLPPQRKKWHEPVVRTYGDEEITECRVCGVEWPCPAFRAIKSNMINKRKKEGGK